MSHGNDFRLLYTPEQWDNIDSEVLNDAVHLIQSQPHLFLTTGTACRNFESLLHHIGR